jgi:S1-C subfamily serine protease
MMAVIVLVAAAAPAPLPILTESKWSETVQWNAIAASPRVISRIDESTTTSTATGVTIGVRGEFAYILTALHALPDTVTEREVQFFSKATYPEPARRYYGVEIALRWNEPDLALLRVRVGSDPTTSLPLAGPGDRPKTYPFPALSVGCTNGMPPTCRLESVIGKQPAHRPNDTVAFFWELASSPVAGRSGGPLIDERGRVIGLCAASQDGRGYYTHLDEILFALKRQGLDWLWPERR